MKFKSANIPNEEGKEFDINEFNRVLLYPDLVPYSAAEVKILVEIRISELEYQIDQLDLKEGIDLLSEEEYHVLSLDFANKMKSDPKPSNGYNELLLDWVAFEKTRLIDKLIVLNPEQSSVKKIARASYAIKKNLNLIHFAELGDELNILFDELKKNEFLDSNLRANEFSRIFSDKDLDTAITWKGTQAELSYFIKELKLSLVNKSSYLKRATLLFHDSDYKPFNPSNLGNPNSDIRPDRESLLRNATERLLQSIEVIRRRKSKKD